MNPDSSCILIFLGNFILKYNKRMNLKNFLYIIVFMLVFIDSKAQKNDEFNKLRNEYKRELQQFRKQAINDLDEYRKSINQEYIEQLRRPWTPLQDKNKIEPIEFKEPPFPPVIKENDTTIELIDKPVPIDTIVLVPVPKPQPVPIYTIQEDPDIKNPDLKFKFYGTDIELRGAKFKDFNLMDNDENNIANGWEELLNKDNDNFILDCLEARKMMKLPDWGFFKFIDASIAQYLPSGEDSHTLVMCYVLTQCGYKTYLCQDDNIKKLHLLFVSNDTFTNREFYTIDGEKAYAYRSIPSDRVYISQFKEKGNQLLSIALTNTPNFTYLPEKNSYKTVVKHPGIELKCSPNKNLVDFYNDYPEGYIGSDVYSKWAIHGNTPMSKEVKESIYPTLKTEVTGKSHYDAVNFLLNVAQSFPYEYDDKIWNRDRAFWPEESWYYPYSDCEDHAIHFTRLVRDILNLNAVLIYYPGHLSAAIEMTDGSQKGDYVVYNGRKYTVCDATYFYASAGMTAPSNDNSSAVLIPLRK